MNYANIPTDGSGRILVTDIGFHDQSDELVLICQTDTTTTQNMRDYYLHPSMQTTSVGYRIQSTDPRGWRRNRDNGIVRLRRDSATTNWTEGVFTCEFMGINDSPISVGVYYSSEIHYTVCIYNWK